eukprot:CAMPEP_0184861486 /NCGR_PEP_ID=MMETSP0580-20130426/6164_1 /TAXON_ID=1118495 /ORGANISM="Dactyliosolen fragilissimus" /LENGTH=323 /DNA_ID=CAMNT_0027359003 /DNA_START=29 /DNA_END=1000 /DNA_ORIENTATION=-
MSLSLLNYPPLVASTGIGLGFGLPYMQQLATNVPWTAVKVASAVAYGINFLSVSRPGRLDGQAAAVANDGELSPRNGKTLVAPAGWAFTIWAPIFLGELTYVTYQFFVPESSLLVPTLRKISAPFIASQLFQSLWCAAFRPKYKGNLMFISTGLLSATAYSLSKAHKIFSNQSNVQGFSALQYGILCLPLALHFGWTTAASLVNLNGAIAMKESSSSKVIAIVGHLSVILASILGVGISATRSSPVFGGVITWALLAVADSMKSRIEMADIGKGKKVKEIPGIYGAYTQLILSKAGALVSGLTSAFVASSIFFSNSSKAVPAP